MCQIHVPVMCEQVLTLLTPTSPGLFVDVTVGLGGHASALLQAAPGLRLIGLDRDPQAIRRAGQRLQSFADRVHLFTLLFSDFTQALDQLGEREACAILADLGCSSLQLDTPERGFSFMSEGPLDMRMGCVEKTAADIVNLAEPEELMRILWEYGEERYARDITRAITRRRRRRSFATTSDLSSLIYEVVGSRHSQRIHPATRTFQALRIAVNDELGQLERFLEPAVTSLRPGGRLCVISFHSLEDRIVKHTLRRLTGECSCPRGLPQCVCKPRRLVKELTRRPLRATPAEVQRNPRARSARLRAAERLEVK